MTPEPALIADTPAIGVLRLRLNRPERRNALATPLLLAIADALDAAAGDDGVRCALVTGGDTVFAAGADIGELAAAGDDDPIDSPRFLAWARIRGFAKPLVGAVEGWCLGAGCELALCCDILIAGEAARFGQPETNLGIMPGAGGTATLTRLIGRARAMDMVLTGEPITAAAAREAGMVARLAPTGEAGAAALALATTIAARAPLALRAAKASVRDAEAMTESEHLRAERARFVALLGSDDKAEGIAAFREKRAPAWRGS